MTRDKRQDKEQRLLVFWLRQNKRHMTKDKEESQKTKDK